MGLRIAFMTHMESRIYDTLQPLSIYLQEICHFGAGTFKDGNVKKYLHTKGKAYAWIYMNPLQIYKPWFDRSCSNPAYMSHQSVAFWPQCEQR